MKKDINNKAPTHEVPCSKQEAFMKPLSTGFVVAEAAEKGETGDRTEVFEILKEPSKPTDIERIYSRQGITSCSRVTGRERVRKVVGGQAFSMIVIKGMGRAKQGVQTQHTSKKIKYTRRGAGYTGKR